MCRSKIQSNRNIFRSKSFFMILEVCVLCSSDAHRACNNLDSTLGGRGRTSRLKSGLKWALITWKNS